MKPALRCLLASMTVVSVACGSSATVTKSAPTTTSSTTTTTAHGSPSTTQTPFAAEVHLSEKNNGTTVRVTPGTTIVVVLASTYWKFPNPPNPAVLAQVGSPTTAPAPIGSCVPGAGCGTVTADYKAVGMGKTQISASRTTCGEALVCSGSAGSYAVSVEVTAA